MVASKLRKYRQEERSLRRSNPDGMAMFPWIALHVKNTCSHDVSRKSLSAPTHHSGEMILIPG